MEVQPGAIRGEKRVASLQPRRSEQVVQPDKPPCDSLSITGPAAFATRPLPAVRETAPLAPRVEQKALGSLPGNLALGLALAATGVASLSELPPSQTQAPLDGPPGEMQYLLAGGLAPQYGHPPGPGHTQDGGYHFADPSVGSTRAGAIDRAVGKNLAAALDGQTLASGAANAKHLAKMEQSASIVSTVERLPSRLDSIVDFKVKDAFRLYRHCFPNPDEREPVADIRARIKGYKEPLSEDGAMFHAHVYADKDGAVVGYSQGSTVPSEAGLFYYWQYGCVADRDYMEHHYGKDVNPREQGILNTIHGVNAATLLAAGAHAHQPVLGMMWESEPRGLGSDPASVRFTDTRLRIHTRAGGRVLMGMTDNGELVNLHLQPRLTADSEPIALHIMFRPLQYEEGEEHQRGEMKKSDAEAMMMGWIDNFRREGFAEKDVKEAEDEIRARLARCTKVVLLPGEEVPDAVTLAHTDPILAKQILEMYQVDNLEAARAFYEAAHQGS